MIKRIEAAEFVRMSREWPLLDVRSPGEYTEGHIPGARSFPLFSDEERAEIGTTYKQLGSIPAVELGLEKIGPRLADMFREGMSHAREGRVMVYCWRGGNRSASVASLLATGGLQVYVLQGGYKAFRNFCIERFDTPYTIRVLSGKTGSGKTEILSGLADAGEQVIDLEALADHRGSSFGRLGMSREVTQQQFENDLAVELFRIDAERPLWLEDESRTIGRCILPEKLYNEMQECMTYVVDFPDSVRVERLIADYGEFPKMELRAATDRIFKKLGGKRYRKVLDDIESGDAEAVVQNLLMYYDKTYLGAIRRREVSQMRSLSFDSFDLGNIVAALRAALNAEP